MGLSSGIYKLDKLLFRLTPSDDSVSCLFDVVYKSYCKINGLEDNIDTVKKLGRYCQKILKLKSVVWNESQLTGAFTLKVSEIKQKYESIKNIIDKWGNIPGDHTSELIAKLDPRVQEISEHYSHIEAENTQYMKTIDKMRIYVGDDIEQGVANIVKFWEQCLKNNFNTMYDANMRNDESAISKEVRYYRSRSPRIMSPSSKENISNHANKKAPKLNSRKDEILKKTNKAIKGQPKSGFSLKNVNKQM